MKWNAAENVVSMHYSLSMDTTRYQLRACDLFLSQYRYTKSPTPISWGCKNLSLLYLDRSLYAWFVKRSCCWCKITSMLEIQSCLCVNWLHCVHNSCVESPLLCMREFSIAIVSASPNWETGPPPGSCCRSSSCSYLIAFSATGFLLMFFTLPISI